MQRGFGRWPRDRTDPEPHCWGCKPKQLSPSPPDQPWVRWEGAPGPMATLCILCPSSAAEAWDRNHLTMHSASVCLAGGHTQGPATISSF